MSKYFDTHCHLAAFQSHDRLEDHLFLQCHCQFLSVGTSAKDWDRTLELSKRFPQVYSALGLHPWFVDEDFESALTLLDDYLSSETGIVAIGEMGLDYSSNYRPTQSLQKIAFEKQLLMAQEYHLPVSVHCYKAYNDALSYLKKIPVLGVMHGFSGGAELAQQFVKIGMKIGINGVVLNSNARRYHQMVKGVGLHNLVLETDVPFGANLPESNPFDVIEQIAEQVALLLNCSLYEVIDQTGYNAEKILLKEHDEAVI